MGKIRDDSSLVFGRCLALLLVTLFVLTGTQMGLSLVRDPGGTVLGDDDDERGNKWWNKYKTVVTVTPTAAPTQASSGESSSATPEESIKVTATPTQATITVTSSPTPPPEADQPLAGTATATPTAAASGESSSATPEESSQPSVGEAVRTILRQIGLPVSVKPTPAPIPEKITVKEEVINERQAGEILRELSSLVGSGVQREVRLRFVASDGGVGITAEVEAGQGVPLSVEEVARISETLRLGSGIKIDRGSGQELVFSRGTAVAATGLPLLVDLDSNTLTVETSLGIKSVAVLPDTAMAKAVLGGALAEVAPGAVKFVERDDGKIAYRMSGKIKRRLFGFFGIKAEKIVDVSAESGRVLPDLTDSLGATLFNLVAPQTK